MKCEKAQFLMALFIAGDPDLTEQQCISFWEHLKTCTKCVREYEESKFVIDLAKQHWQISDDTLALIEKAGESYKPKITVEEGCRQDIIRRCPDLVESDRKRKSLQFILRISTIAACLVIGVLFWMTISHYSKSHTLPQISYSEQVASALKPSVKVELVTPSGNIVVATGQKIIADKELKTILINGRHQMIMNTGTSLSVEPILANTELGCLVKLTAGEIYTYVEHDGNPFVVNTTNSKAVITGTIFDVRVTEDSTTLVVAEGSVQFESESGVVNVAAGQTSEVVGQSAPSIPLSCNTPELTAWTTDHKPVHVLAQAESDSDDWYTALSLRQIPIVLAETDYYQWVEEKREWFKKDFPWVFELKDALLKEGIKVDYSELLIESGDVWQFVCLRRFPARFSVPDFDSLLKTAASYGFDRKWLLENVPKAKTIQDKYYLSGNPTGLAAFEQLLKYANGTEVMPYYSYPADVCKYLTETRSLIWFAIRDGKYNLTHQEYTEVLSLLQEEVTAACNYRNNILYPDKGTPDPSCDNNDINKKASKYIEIIKTSEIKLAQYEFNKKKK